MIISSQPYLPPSTGTGAAIGRDPASGAGAAQSPKSGPSQVESSLALSESERRQLDKLKARDREVRAHEAAHQGVGGQYAGAASFSYQRGPDGVQYAIGGEVPIELSAVEGNPQATVEKMRIIQAAAMAPAQPSAQDRAVAAEAAQIQRQAQAEMAQNARSSQERTQEGARTEGRAAVETYRSISGMSPRANSDESARLDLSI